MKKILLMLAFCLCTIQFFAQAPQRISYQAVIRNVNNVLVANAPVRMRISILQGSITGNSVYSEFHSAITNASGVVFLEIGGGTAPTGSFASINWAQGPFFLRSETDPNNGTNYSIVGTTQLLSVPYALQSNRSSRADSANNGLPATTSYGVLQLFNCNGVVQYVPCLPLLTTASVDSISLVSAVSGGNISTDGGASVTDRGVVWSTSANPTIALATKTSNGNGTGVFKSNLSGLAAGTTYFLRAYATNSSGTAYGNELSFRTGGALPILTTSNISSISGFGANAGGNVTNDGGSAVTERGVVWSTVANPTVMLSTKLSNGSGVGSFSVRISNLKPNTLYYVRAYAINSFGTSYGNEISFRTAKIPVLTTSPITSITSTGATGGGNITDSGSATVTARGIVWSTSQNPNVSLLTKTSNGTGVGAFVAGITGLVSGTTYFVRAYATSSAGTAYGTQVSFTTAAPSPYPTGTVHCNNTPTAISDVTNPLTGRAWMDRNLGASRSATSSTDAAAYGDLYQWGRGADGHQCRNSMTTTMLSSTDQPMSGGVFILSPNNPNDWRSPQNNNLWQGLYGINNPCPTGYRLPTQQEFQAELTSWGSNQNAAGAFASPLKFTKGGYRDPSTVNGSILNAGGGGDYWTSTVSSTAIILEFFDDIAYISGSFRAQGNSVRCIKDPTSNR